MLLLTSFVESTFGGLMGSSPTTPNGAWGSGCLGNKSTRHPRRSHFYFYTMTSKNMDISVDLETSTEEEDSGAAEQEFRHLLWYCLITYGDKIVKKWIKDELFVYRSKKRAHIK